MDPMMLRRILPALLLLMLMLWDVSIRPAGSTIFVVTSENATFTFFDAEATFGSAIAPGGIEGVLVEANPLDACSPLENSDPYLRLFPDTGRNVSSLPTTGGHVHDGGAWFALVIRGSCSFEQKVLNAQNAGADAVIVFDNERNRELIRMAGRNVADIVIPAVFVDNRAGRQLQFLLQSPGTRVWIVPTIEDTSLSALAVAFIATVCVTAVMASFFFMRRRQAELAAAGAGARADAPVGLSAAEIKMLPTLIFKSAPHDPEVGADGGDSSWSVCAVCLEEYADGDKLRLLPCRHEFHSACIDPWLTSRRTCCPVCKREVMPSLSAAAPSSSSSTGMVSGGAASAVTATLAGGAGAGVASHGVSERVPLLRDQPGSSGATSSCAAPSASSAPAAVPSLSMSTAERAPRAATAGAPSSPSSSIPDALAIDLHTSDEEELFEARRGPQGLPSDSDDDDDDDNHDIGRVDRDHDDLGEDEDDGHHRGICAHCAGEGSRGRKGPSAHCTCEEDLNLLLPAAARDPVGQAARGGGARGALASSAAGATAGLAAMGGAGAIRGSTDLGP